MTAAWRHKFTFRCEILKRIVFVCWCVAHFFLLLCQFSSTLEFWPVKVWTSKRAVHNPTYMRCSSHSQLIARLRRDLDSSTWNRNSVQWDACSSIQDKCLAVERPHNLVLVKVGAEILGIVVLLVVTVVTWDTQLDPLSSSSDVQKL